MQSKVVLILSLCVNLGLIGALAHYVKDRGETGAPTTQARTATAKTGSSPTPADKAGDETAASGPNVVPAGPAAAKFSWREIEAADYKEYIAKLRGVACPEETIRDIITADVNKLYAPRFAALREPEQDFKFWKRNYGWGPQPDKEKQKQTKQLVDERDALLKDLLGTDQKKELNWWEEQQAQRLSFLAPEKQEQLRKIQQKYDEERQEIYRAASGYFDEETQADLRKIYQKQLADLAQFMTPEEIQEYRVRTSDTANNLRYQLSSMSLTEQEFRDIFQAKSALEDVQSPTDEERADKDFMKKRSEAIKEADTDLKAKLGDERYTEYTRSQDYAYTSLINMGELFGFDKAAVNKVYDMKKEAETQANKIRTDKSLSREQRDEALRAVRSTTTKAITDAIGEKGYKAYRRQGGYWLSNISPN